MQAAVRACVRERGDRRGVREQEERLIGILVLCRGRDAREAEIIPVVELNLNGQSARSTVLYGASLTKLKRQGGNSSLKTYTDVMAGMCFFLEEKNNGKQRNNYPKGRL